MTKQETPGFHTLQPFDDVGRVEFVQGRIKDYIIKSNLRPGDKLPTEAQLAEVLRVSRTAIREAFRSLQALGIVEARQGYGRIVCDFNFSAIVNNLSYGLAFHNHGVYQAHEIRKSLESYFIESAIDHITAEDIEELTAMTQRMKALNSDEFERFREEDYRFHRLLFCRSGNELALQLFDITWKVTDAALIQQRIYKDIPADLASEHEAIVEAIKQQDAGRACKILLAHFASVERRLIQRLEQEEVEVPEPGDLQSEGIHR